MARLRGEERRARRTGRREWFSRLHACTFPERGMKETGAFVVLADQPQKAADPGERGARLRGRPCGRVGPRGPLRPGSLVAGGEGERYTALCTEPPGSVSKKSRAGRAQRR